MQATRLFFMFQDLCKISREMAIDAGDHSLCIEWVNNIMPE